MNINRNIFDSLCQQIHDPKISILIGPRQVGKTHLLKELQLEVNKQGFSSCYFDLEQPDDLLAMGSTQQQQLKTLISNGQFVFIDELHLLKNISRLFKAVFDRNQGIKIFASGSSSLEMHKHLKESMAGRTIMNRVWPLCFSEAKQHPIPDDFAYFCRFGGLPGQLHCKNEQEIIQLLTDITATYITKDIKGLLKEENVRAFNQLLYLLAQNQGSIVVTANLARETGLSKPTLEKYLEILNQTYVCHVLYSYSSNLGNELKKSKKVYLYDLGIRNQLLKDFRRMKERPDQGIIYESFVFLSLIQQLKPNMEIRFWRTKHGQEVDFVVIKNREPIPIEVKSKITQGTIPIGLEAFLRRYPKTSQAFVFNTSLETQIQYHQTTIHFLPHDHVNHFEPAQRVD